MMNTKTMNRQVKRYDPISRDGTCGMCIEDADYGAYVEYEDYVALEAENARLREALAHCSEVMKDPWKHGEGCISRAINRADAALAASTGEE